MNPDTFSIKVNPLISKTEHLDTKGNLDIWKGPRQDYLKTIKPIAMEVELFQNLQISTENGRQEL